jgi:hypothetical protein
MFCLTPIAGTEVQAALRRTVRKLQRARWTGGVCLVPHVHRKRSKCIKKPTMLTNRIKIQSITVFNVVHTIYII